MKVGEPVTILKIHGTDGALIEAPSIIRTYNGIYYNFFSFHCFSSLGYNTDGSGQQSPGEATVSREGNKIVFHANCEARRYMYSPAINIRSRNTIVPPFQLIFLDQILPPTLPHSFELDEPYQKLFTTCA
ncbi:hypothetical protein N7495_000831 [Penicillium taxi]|uniref:uncharacterized protein n=1 Tax=Penicillium taxi TaxID=168475 RepID=UPI0025456809|nr:uncharacterized protein N7495_000831 [Penicillium taxi]KAJ5908149.1 hypothetical protein N7495_000831 [Penicillium taxi]